MARPSRYSAGFRARAVRLVAEARPDHDTGWAAITSVATKLGVSTETVRTWVRRAPALPPASKPAGKPATHPLPSPNDTSTPPDQLA